MEKQIKLRNYEGSRLETSDYKKLHDFLVESKNTEYTYARFDWMMMNWEYLDDEFLTRIGIWEQNGKIVAANLYDHSLDDIFPIVLPGYEFLYEEMVSYAKKNMMKEENGHFRIFACDSNRTLQKVLKSEGMMASEEKDMVAIFNLSEEIPVINLKEGYRITSLAEEREYDKYMLCLFKGFGHEEAGETFSFTEVSLQDCKAAYERNYLDLNLKLSVVDEQGNYIAHAGMWYDKSSEFALIEPVCVVPEYRKMGFGREVVYEGLRRVKQAGAKYAVVGSNQQFYYSIGMVPYSTGTFWID